MGGEVSRQCQGSTNVCWMRNDTVLIWASPLLCALYGRSLSHRATDKMSSLVQQRGKGGPQECVRVVESPHALQCVCMHSHVLRAS